MNKLWVLYLDGLTKGVAVGPSAEKVVEQMRAALLGGKPQILTAVDWDEAPIDDCLRAGLGTLMQLTFAAQAQMAAMQAGQTGRIVRQ